MIIFWKNFTATRFGVARRQVECEQCRAGYEYTLQRQVQGHGISWYCLMNDWAAEVAESRASARLAKALAYEVDPIPCPACGYFQRNMVREARRRCLKWMSWRFVGLALLLYPVVCLFFLIIPNGVLDDEGPVIPWPVFYACLGGIGALIALAPFFRPLLALPYNPNRDSESARIRKGYCGGTLRNQDASKADTN